MRGRGLGTHREAEASRLISPIVHVNEQPFVGSEFAVSFHDLIISLSVRLKNLPVVLLAMELVLVFAEGGVLHACSST